MSSIDFVIIYIFLFLFFYIYGRKCSLAIERSQYWRYAIVLISLFVLIEGCRYCRGVDYYGYKLGFTNPNFDNNRGNITLKMLNALINSLGFDYVGAFAIYALLFITSTLFLLKSFNKESKYMFAFLLPLTLIFSENMIRQALSLSFIFFGMAYLLKMRKILAAIFFIISLFFHIGNIVLLTWVIIFMWIKTEKPLSWKCSIVINFFVLFMFDQFFFGNVNSYISLINLGDLKYQAYIENSDRWFSGNAFDKNILRSTFSLISKAVFDFSYFIPCYYACKLNMDKKVISLYNITVVGIILCNMTYTNMIFIRMFIPLQLLIFIPLGYGLYHIKELNSKYKFKNLKVMKVLIVIPVSWYILYSLRWIFFNPDTLFIWSNIQNWNTNLHSVFTGH